MEQMSLGEEVKRKDLLVNITRDMLSLGLHGFYNISYKNIDEISSLNERGFVLLPKHQHLIDIILEGIVLKKGLRRNGNYIMKESLPKILEHYGGVPIVRGKDIVKDSKASRKELIEEAKKQRDKVIGTIRYFLSVDEIVVIHPEGTRLYQRNGELNKPLLRNLVNMQNELGKEIPFVPLKIEYEKLGKPFSQITLTVGKPIYTDNASDLAARVEEAIYF